jgi:hypothetical protein
VIELGNETLDVIVIFGTCISFKIFVPVPDCEIISVDAWVNDPIVEFKKVLLPAVWFIPPAIDNALLICEEPPE